MLFITLLLYHLSGTGSVTVGVPGKKKSDTNNQVNIYLKVNPIKVKKRETALPVVFFPLIWKNL